MSSVTGVGSTNAINTADLGPTSSLQLMFAKLQLELSETAKNSAMDKMKSIQSAQDEQKLVSKLLNEARQAQANAKNGNAADITTTYSLESKGTDGKVTTTSKTETAPQGAKYTPMSPDMVKYMDAQGLAYDKTGNDHMHTEEEWKVAIASLESRLEEVGTDTQQQMVYVQDFMGQYNSYLQGANTQIANSNQTLTSLARGQ